jgi:hypothetical protein
MRFVVAMTDAASRIAPMAPGMAPGLALPMRMSCALCGRCRISLSRGVAKQRWQAEKQSQEDRYETETFGH